MLKNGLYNLISALIRNGFSIVSIPILIRLIGLESYGLWTLVTSGVAIVGLAQGGLSVATTVFVARDLGNGDREGILQTITFTLTGMFGLATFASVFLWVSAPFLINFFPALESQDYELATKAWQIGSIVIWTRLIQQVLIGISQAYQQYKIINIINTVQVFIANIGLIGVAWLGQDIGMMMLSEAVIGVLILFCYIVDVWRLIRHLNPCFLWNAEKARGIIKYSVMTWLISIGTTAFGQGDRLIVGGILGTKMLGLYSAITTIAAQINTLSAIAVQPMLPTLSGLLTNKQEDRDEKKTGDLIKKSLQLNINVACLIGVTIIVLSPWILKIVVGDSQIDFNHAVFGLQITSFIYTLYSLNANGYYILFSLNALNTLFFVISIASLLSLGLIAIGSSHYGLVGACVGNGGYLLLLLLTFIGMNKINIPRSQWISSISKSLSCFIIFSAAVMVFTPYLFLPR
jgi:O-antigen/teichoic acid export membrane protein